MTRTPMTRFPWLIRIRFLGLLEILPIAKKKTPKKPHKHTREKKKQKKKTFRYSFGKFSYFIMKMYVVCTH